MTDLFKEPTLGEFVSAHRIQLIHLLSQANEMFRYEHLQETMTQVEQNRLMLQIQDQNEEEKKDENDDEQEEQKEQDEQDEQEESEDNKELKVEEID